MAPQSAKEKSHSKPCTLCATPRDVLVRCQIDGTGRWHLVCPGKCWKQVSGGMVDGDEAHRHYRYGGMWKNKHEAVSAKMPKHSQKTNKNQARASGASETKDSAEDAKDLDTRDVSSTEEHL